MAKSKEALNVAVVAPSSVVPPVELEIGVARLASEGFAVHVHPQCLSVDGLYAGSDEERANALYDSAMDPRIDVVWAARGGYGATRLLPILDELCAAKGIPERKLFIGYSDSTAIHEFTRSRWNWWGLHASMPGNRPFTLMSPPEWKTLMSLVREGRAPQAASGGKKLRFLANKPARPIQAPLVGGNLAVWSALSGTPFEYPARGKIVVLEDVTESYSRIDRMIEQIYQAGQLDEAVAIVLGEFTDCDDKVATMLKSMPSPRKLASTLRKPRPEDLVPLRKKLGVKDGLERLFADLGKRLGIPVATGLPLGHGARNFAAPLGAEYRLSPTGEFKLLSWDWKGRRRRG